MLVCIPLVSSAPTKFSGTSTLGIEIEHPIATTLKVNETHKFHFHIFNSSTGVPIKADKLTANCSFHLYNSSGSHILKVNDVVSSDDIYDYEQIVTGGNFSKVGEYSYVFQCNTSSSGGFYGNNFFVTYLGEEVTTARSLFNLGFLFLLVFTFLILVIGINLIEDNEVRDDYGQLLSVDTLKYFKGTLVAIAYGVLLAIFFCAYNISLVFLSGELFSNIFFVIYKILMIGGVPFIVIWFIWLFVNIFRDKETQRIINNGMGGDSI